MTNDPFGNLREWGTVLERLGELEKSGALAQCQHGLIRILRYKGNWRLREEVLKRVGKIASPSDGLADQVLAVVADDNIYYDARILAADALVRLLKAGPGELSRGWVPKIRKVVGNLFQTPQPPFFDAAIKRLDTEVCRVSALEN